jgi:hypothetical protein
MPGRWIALTIVAFWLAMMGWLAGHELWQHFGPPPRLEDSLKAAAADGPTHWVITHKYERIGTAETQVVALEEPGGRYQLRQHLHCEKPAVFFEATGLGLLAKVLGIANVQGDAHIHFNLSPAGDLEKLEVEILQDANDVLLQIVGTPEGKELKLQATTPHARGLQWEFAIPYEAKNVIQTSLCPLDRMPGLWPGRRWEAPMVDPARSMASQMLQRAPVQVRVRDEPVNFHWTATRDWVSCLVVDAEQPEQDLHIEIWVNQADGRVLKQRARWGKLELEIERKTVNEREQRILNGERLR